MEIVIPLSNHKSDWLPFHGLFETELYSGLFSSGIQEDPLFETSVDRGTRNAFFDTFSQEIPIWHVAVKPPRRGFFYQPLRESPAHTTRTFRLAKRERRI